MTENPAITLSRSLGSEGTEVGFHVARRLGWHFCDRRILRLAAGVMGQSVADVARQEERASGFKDWLLTVFAQGSPEAPYTPLLDLPTYSSELFAVQKEVIRGMVEHAPSVIVGRGGFIALKGRPLTLHVSLHADLDFRVRSLVARGKAQDEREARAAIAASDRGRAEFIRAIAGVDWRNPGHFDLVLDSSKEGSQACVERILEEAAKRFGPMPAPGQKAI